jgi:hypothetical protein
MVAGPLLVMAVSSPPLARAASFVDVAQPLGLAQRTQSLGATVADLNGDDRADVLLNHQAQAPPTLYLRKADGTYQDSGTVFGPFVKPNKDLHGCSTADVNADGLVDVYCTVGTNHQTTTNKSNFLWIQHVDGTFTNRASTWGVSDPAGRGRDALFLDVNDDGLPDLFVYNAKRTDGVLAPSRLFVNTGGSFNAARSYGLDGAFWSLPIAVPELQQTRWNGHLGLLAVTTAGPQLWVQQAGPGAPFERVAPKGWPTHVVQGARLKDLDRDGLADLVAVTKRRADVWLASADSSFTRAWSSPTSGARNVKVADATGDGLPDIYVTTWSMDTSKPNPPDFLFVNTGGVTFTSATIPQAESGQGASAAVLPYASSNAFLVANGPSTQQGPIQVIAEG